MLEYAIGIGLALIIGVVARYAGFERDRAFYPTVLIVIAGFYVLFAVMSQSPGALLPEAGVAAGFAAIAIVGFRTSLWLVVVGLVLHGFFDYGHHRLIDNAGVPVWWPGFCLAVDVTLGLWLAVVLATRQLIPKC